MCCACIAGCLRTTLVKNAGGGDFLWLLVNFLPSNNNSVQSSRRVLAGDACDTTHLTSSFRHFSSRPLDHIRPFSDYVSQRPSLVVPDRLMLQRISTSFLGFLPALLSANDWQVQVAVAGRGAGSKKRHGMKGLAAIAAVAAAAAAMKADDEIQWKTVRGPP